MKSPLMNTMNKFRTGAGRGRVGGFYHPQKYKSGKEKVKFRMLYQALTKVCPLPGKENGKVITGVAPDVQRLKYLTYGVRSSRCIAV